MLVHDAVASFLDPARRNYDPAIPGMLRNIEILCDAARNAGVPIIFAAPGSGETVGPRSGQKVEWGSPACDPPPSLGPKPGDIIVRKPRYGAFRDTRLLKELARLDRDLLVVCGLSLAGGVETTIRDAHNHDLRCILVRDACLCRPIADQGWGVVAREDVERVTLSILAERFARVATTAEICADLSR